MTRRKFIHTAVATSGAVATGLRLAKAATPAAVGTSTFLLGGDLTVKRMGFLLR